MPDDQEPSTMPNQLTDSVAPDSSIDERSSLYPDAEAVDLDRQFAGPYPADDTEMQSNQYSAVQADVEPSIPPPSASPVDEPLAAAPAAPVASGFSVVEAESSPPTRKHHGKFLIGLVVAGAFAFLSAGGALAYNVWYQNPDKVLTDAMQNLITAESVNFDGAILVDEDDNKFDASFGGALAGSSGKISSDMKYDIDGQSYEMVASAIFDKDATLFFKVSNVKDVLGILSDGADTSLYNPVIAKVDDQWIRLDQDDDSMAKEQACMANVFSRVLKDGSANDDLKRLYLENRMIEVKNKLTPKSIYDIDSIGYEIGVNSKAVESFAKGLDDTQLARDLRECDKEFSFKVDDAADNEEYLKDTKIDIYVSRWSHELTQVIVSSKDDETQELVVNTVFGESASIDSPTESKTLEEVMRAVQEAFISSFDLEEA